MTGSNNRAPFSADTILSVAVSPFYFPDWLDLFSDLLCQRNLSSGPPSTLSLIFVKFMMCTHKNHNVLASQSNERHRCYANPRKQTYAKTFLQTFG